MKTSAKPKPIAARDTASSKPLNGETLPVQHGARSPRLPHEIDESAHSQTTEPTQPMKQAYDDLQRGLVDGDRGPVIDELYSREFRQKEQAPASSSDPSPKKRKRETKQP